MKLFVTSLLFWVMLLTGGVCRGAVLVSVASDAATTSTGSTAESAITAIYAGYRGLYQAPVFVFQLPARAEGMMVDPAATDLSFYTISKGVDLAFNLDVYGVRYNSSSTVLGTDYATGDLIAENITAPSSTVGLRYSTDSSGDSSLAAWIDDQYDAGASAGDYVFIMLMPDSTVLADWDNYIRVESGEGTSLPERRPLLTINFTEAPPPIPEPASLGLVALSIAVFWMLRRRS